MADFSRIYVYQKILEAGIIPIFYHPDAKTCKAVIKTCFDAGLRTFEFTNRGNHAHEIFSELHQYVVQELPGMILGTGSVIDAPTAVL